MLLVELLIKLPTLKRNVDFIIFNQKELIAYGVHQHKLLQVLENCPSILTLEIVNCTIVNHYKLATISIKCKYIRNLKICCYKLNSIMFQNVCRVLFSNQSAINFLKELDFSHNSLKPTTILDCLCNCVIETLIISHSGIQGFEECILTAYYYGGMRIQNFILDILLVVVNNCAEQDKLFASVFLKKFDLNNKNACNFFGDFRIFDDAYYELFLLNSYVMLNDLPKSDLSLFHYLVHNYARVFILETNLCDVAVVTLYRYLKELQRTLKLEYLITSATKIFADTSNEQLFATAINENPSIVNLTVSNDNFEIGQIIGGFSTVSRVWHDIDLSGCKMEDKTIKIISENNSLFTNAVYIKVLNLSNNSLTVSSIYHILKILQFCVIEKLILLDNFIRDDSFTELIHDHCQSFQSIANFKCGIPLVINRSDVNNTTNIYNIYLLNYQPNENDLLPCLLDKVDKHMKLLSWMKRRNYLLC